MTSDLPAFGQLQDLVEVGAKWLADGIVPRKSVVVLV